MGDHKDTVIDQLRPAPGVHDTLNRISRLLAKHTKEEQDRLLAALRALYPVGES